MKAYSLPAAARPAIRVNRTNSGGGRNQQSRLKQNPKQKQKKKSGADSEPIYPNDIKQVSGYGRRNGVDDRRSPDKSKRNRSIDVRI
ncbi:MAG: hypothetical protein QNJ58_26440 [Desulfobacterales bacterium]|nr:hypothetical protein [Desulfobacterales bacterium]